MFDASKFNIPTTTPKEITQCFGTVRMENGVILIETPLEVFRARSTKWKKVHKDLYVLHDGVCTGFSYRPSISDCAVYSDFSLEELKKGFGVGVEKDTVLQASLAGNAVYFTYDYARYKYLGLQMLEYIF